jgi:hypothetical protein
MSKKYQIINSNIDTNTSDECTIFYLLYIVLFFVIVFIIYKIIFCFSSPKEGFANVSTSTKNITTTNKNSTTTKSPQQMMNELKQKNDELSKMKDTLQNKLLEQSQAIYMSQHFNKVDPSSFNDQLSYLLIEFADTRFPELDMDKKKVITTQTELDTVLAEAANMKNIYKPGDIVTANSTFNITKDDICYRQNNKLIKPTPDFISKYPNCMVCEVENEDDDIDLTNTSGWQHTKTNISKVCLYNPKATPNSGIPNLAQCKTFCNIGTNKPKVNATIPKVSVPKVSNPVKK